MRFAVALLALAACASDEATELDYAKSAKANYEKGKSELADGNYLEAERPRRCPRCPPVRPLRLLLTTTPRV